MPTTSTVLPPSISFSRSTVYASQGSVYALEASSGTLRQHYPINGLAYPTVVNDVLYLNVSRHPDYLIQALRGDDGTPLWSYRVEGRLSGAPVIVDEVVYASVAEGTIYALQASDGTLLWRSTIDLGPDVPFFVGPIVFASPTVAEKTVYLAPAVNAPLKPFVYAFQTENGTLLWKAPFDSSTTLPLTIADGVLYLCTHSSCLALRASDGSSLWQYETSGLIRSSPVVVDGVVCFSLSTFRQAFSNSGQISHLHEAFICTLQATDGSLLWQQQLGITMGASHPTAPAEAHGTIYVGADDGYLYALRTGDGTPLWSYKTNATLLSLPVVAQDVLYVGGNDGCVYALHADDGMLLWKTFVSDSVTVSGSVMVHHEEREE
jgi:outer membrane protein assembly factor BamB